MSITTTYDVFCDGKGCINWAEGYGSTVSATNARRLASTGGWVRRNGKDLCPDCARPEPLPLIEVLADFDPDDHG